MSNHDAEDNLRTLPSFPSGGEYVQMIYVKIAREPRRSLALLLAALIGILLFLLLIGLTVDQTSGSGAPKEQEVVIIFSPDDPTVQVYAPNNDVLHTAPEVTWPHRRKYAGVTEFFGKIYLIGGSFGPDTAHLTPSDQVDIYDPTTATWTLGPQLTVARSSKVVVQVADKIMVCGCWTNWMDCWHTCDVLTGESATEWTTMPYGLADSSPKACLKKGAGVAMGNRAYLMGGICSTPDTVMHIYDADTRAWTDGANMPNSRYAHSAAVAQGRVYVCGGANAATNTPVDSFVLLGCDIYDPADNRWSSGQPMISARRNAPLMSIPTLNRLVIIGGSSGALSHIDHIDMFDVAMSIWKNTSSRMASKDDEHCAVVTKKTGYWGWP